MTNILNNPLYKIKGLPNFAEIKAEHVEPAFSVLFAEELIIIEQIEQESVPVYPLTTEDNIKKFNYLFNNVVVKLETYSKEIEVPFTILQCLLANSPTDELRNAFANMQREYTSHKLRISQSEKLYKINKFLQNNNLFISLPNSYQRIINKSIKIAELSGISLDEENKNKFNNISIKLSELGIKYFNNVPDSSKNFKKILTKESEIEGLTMSWRSLTSMFYNQYHQNMPISTPENGPWLITSDVSCLVSILEFAENRELRKEIEIIKDNIATDGVYDNEIVLLEILKCRKEIATLLGYNNYAEISLENKMINSVDNVNKFCDDLLTATEKLSQQEVEEIKQFVLDNGVDYELQSYDMLYWFRKWKEVKINFDEEQIKQYFQLAQVLKGLFDLADTLFDIVFVEVIEHVSKWHKDVRYFKVLDKKNQEIAGIYMDLYARAGIKRPGAWAVGVIPKTSSTIPIAIMTCNFTPPILGNDAELKYTGELTLLVHEFGHTLQHILTEITEYSVGGMMGIETDAIELASQFMEKWLIVPKIIRSMSKHKKTGEILPDLYVNAIQKYQKIGIGTFVRRVLFFSMLDLYLHTEYDPYVNISPHLSTEILAQKIIKIPYYKNSKILSNFLHLFGGGYEAGYYSYLWSEVLCADVFKAFSEVGFDNIEGIKNLGQRYKKTILALGGSKSARDVFIAFRGREPNIIAYLQQCGFDN